MTRLPDFLGGAALVLTLIWLHHNRTSRRQRVLQVFLDRPGQRLRGLDISAQADLPAGSIYPELARLEMERWIFSDWDAEVLPSGRRRRVYWLNPWRSAHEAVR